MPHEHSVDWAEHAPRLAASARAEQSWADDVAAALVRPDDRLAVDVGCGGGGMTRALAHALPAGGRAVGVDGSAVVLDAARAYLADTPTAELVELDLTHGLAPLREVLPGPADIVWASASVHHFGDQQAAVDTLAGLLAANGRLALAEGGVTPRHLPWDVGVGEPGLEVRLAAAQDRWFAYMRAELPGWIRMPYGWLEALRRAGLTEVRTRNWIREQSTLDGHARHHAVESLTNRVDRLREADLLDRADTDAWQRLLDPDGPDWLGHRSDLSFLEVRSVHIGARR